MAQLIASVAARVASAADFVARTAAPVDAHGASPDAYTSFSSSRAIFADEGPAGAGIYRIPPLLKKAAKDVETAVVNGPAFRLEDLPAYIDAAKNLNGGVGIDDRLMLLEKILVLMSRLPTDSEFAKRLEVFVIDILYKDLPHPPAAYIPFSPGYNPSSTSASSWANGNAKLIGNGTNGAANGTNGAAKGLNGTNGAAAEASSQTSSSAHTSTYDASAIAYSARSADGSNYNPLFPNMGKAGTPYARTVPPVNPIMRQSLPNAGLVFDELLMRRPNPKGTTRLPKTDDNGFATHPGGISSMFFAFADLVIHSCFNTNHTAWSVNDVSSYLDLSPLYGSSKTDVDKVRRKDGSGRLWDDVFADSRLLFMPPSVCALLVLFCRNHNIIAEKLLAINEWGTYNSNFDKMDESQRLKQDDEIFERSRLVNCGFFMQIILGDYVGAILGLVRDGLDWRLDPLAASRELDHEVSPRGQGNAVSVEFNLLYRWHATLSQPDTEWTEKLFSEAFNTTDFKSITVDKFIQGLAKIGRGIPQDVRKWKFGDLERDPKTNAFKSADLANILHSATEASASAFKARGIPEVLRVVEIMGIEQARKWGTCTMNEFRSFMGLRPYETFEQWNPDPSVAKAAEMLYGHIDNLELHVGMQAEEAKPAIPGAGLCPGYTISRAILSDAVALVRGDPYLTTEFTVFNLTSWGYQDSYPLKNDGSYGGMLTRLLYRTLPEYYPPGSAYAHFPFMVPTTMKGYLEKLKTQVVSKYTFTRPPAPLPVRIIGGYDAVADVLKSNQLFCDGSNKKLLALTKGLKVDVPMVNTIIDKLNKDGRYSGLFGHIAEKLIREKSVPHLGSSHLHVDIVKDVINLVPIYFITTELLGLPIKTDQTPHGAYRDVELYEKFADISNYLFVNTDNYLVWVLREKAIKSTQMILEIIEDHLHRLSGLSILAKVTDSVSQWYTGEKNFSDLFLAEVLASPLKHSQQTLAASIFAAAVTTAALYSKALVHVVDFYLRDEQKQALARLALAASKTDTQADALLYKYAREALRLSPPVSSITRTTKKQHNFQNHVQLSVGQPVYCNIINANRDTTVFGKNADKPNYDSSHYGILGIPEYGLTDSTLFQSTIPRVLRAIFQLNNLTRATGDSGTLTRVIEAVHSAPEVSYLDFKSNITPFPVSMLIQYDP